jgi:hypothetical protein
MTSVVRFAVDGGIFGVGRLATRLNGLEKASQIGPWHVGHWVDHTHRAIRIRFHSVAEGKLAKVACAS